MTAPRTVRPLPHRSPRAFAPVALATALLLAASAPPALAVWPPDNLQISADILSRTNLRAVPDGIGGMIVVWVEDYRGSQDLYAQRFDASGIPFWDIEGKVICTAAGAQTAPAVVADGTGGAIFVWQDARAGNTDIYAQRLNVSGLAQWTANGVALCTDAAAQTAPDLASDGAGGAIATWTDARAGNANIYVRRITSAGAPQWTANGVALCGAAGEQTAPRIVADGAGGAIVAWRDARGANADVYAHRVNSAGTPQWTADGVALCTATGHQQEIVLVTDGVAGAIAAWRDFRPGATSDIYARRVNSAGTPQWTANGVSLCTAGGDQASPTIGADGAGGAVVAWQDRRGGAFDVYAQRVSSAGAEVWAVNGVALCAAGGDQTGPAISMDGAGGAIVGWQDARSGESDVYARRVTLAGAPEWTANGVAVCTAEGAQSAPAIVPDAVGGAILAWSDPRDGSLEPYAGRVDGAGAPVGPTNGRTLCAANPFQVPYAIVTDGGTGAIVAWEERFRAERDIYAQRVDASGNVLWAAGGVAVCTATGFQMTPTATADGSGGAIIAWPDNRGANSDIYAQRVTGAGAVAWVANGVALTTAPGHQLRPVAVSDGANGAIVVWDDQRLGATSGDIYAQRVSSASAILWAGNGATICNATGHQTNVRAAADGAGGVLAAWEDPRFGLGSDIYVQRLTGASAPVWGMNGVALCAAAADQLLPVVASDGSGGAIVAWQDARNAAHLDIYARRIDSGGMPQWAANGVAVCSVAEDQFAPSIVADGAGGAVVAWRDSRAGGSSVDAYAQRVSNAAGAIQWAAGGVAVTQSGRVGTTPVLAWDGAGVYAAWSDLRFGKHDVFAQRILAGGAVAWNADGDNVAIQSGVQANVQIVLSGTSAILAWHDERTSGDSDAYAQRLVSGGPLDAPIAPASAAVWLAPVSPNPVSAGAEFRFSIARAQPVRLAIFDLQGRRVRRLLDERAAPGARVVRWDGRSDDGARLASGAYFVRLETGEASVARRFAKVR